MVLALQISPDGRYMLSQNNMNLKVTEAASGRIGSGEGAIVLVLTGSGLKALHLLPESPVEIHRFGLDDLEAGLARLVREA